MDNEISRNLETLIRERPNENADISDFILASKEYDILIQKGLVNKRGFNIMTTEEIYNPISGTIYSQNTNNKSINTSGSLPLI